MLGDVEAEDRFFPSEHLGLVPFGAGELRLGQRFCGSAPAEQTHLSTAAIVLDVLAIADRTIQRVHQSLSHGTRLIKHARANHRLDAPSVHRREIHPAAKLEQIPVRSIRSARLDQSIDRFRSHAFDGPEPKSNGPGLSALLFLLYGKVKLGGVDVRRFQLDAHRLAVFAVLRNLFRVAHFQ